MGYMMAYIVLKTGSIVYTMILHFFNNATVLLTTYINQKNGIAETPIDLSNFWNIFLPILFAILAVGAIIGLLVLINILIKKQKAKKQSECASNDENVIVFDEQKNQNLQQSEQLEKFFKKPMSLEKLVVIVGIISAFLIWVLAIVQGFLI
jgi:predicted membrane protein